MNRAILFASLLCATGAASAGDFQLWTLAGKGGEVVLAVSFIGDGVTQDAQLDLAVPAGYRVVSHATKAAGSVCASFPSDSKIRIVPPSGEGQPLPSTLMEVCTFKLVAEKGAMAGAPAFEVVFKECAAPTGETNCGLQSPDLSEK
jgi:hypothetical protein